MEWYLLSLASLLLFSLSSIFQKKLLSKTDLNPVVFGFAFQLLVGVMAVPIFLLKPGVINPNFNIWLFIVIASIFYAISNFMLFWGIKLIEISQASIVGSTKTLWVLIGSAIILKEKLTILKLLGVLLIFLALVILFWQGRKINLSKGHLFILGAAVFSALAYVVDGLILKDFSASLYLVISSLATGLGTFLISPQSAKNISFLFRKTFLIWTIFTSFMFALAVFLLYYSYQIGGTISSIIPITQSAVFLTVILGIFLLKETKDLKRKIIASLISTLGIYLLR